MLSLFPQLLDFVIPTTAVLRIVVGIIFIIEGKRNFSKTQTESSVKKVYALFEIIFGLLLIIGLFTQAVSIALALSIIGRIFNEYKGKNEDKRIYSFYILLFFITLSFLFLGPGMLSIDFPL